MANRFILKNNFSTTLAAGITAAQTAVTVASATGISTPAAGQGILLTLEDPLDPSVNEIVSVTAVSGTSLTIVRAQDGTAAAIWPAGTKVELRLTARILENFPQINVNGNASQATGTESIALGRSATATGNYSAAIGSGAVASLQDGVAIGRNSEAMGLFSVSIGYASDAVSENSIALGRTAKAFGFSSMSLGGYRFDAGRSAGNVIQVGTFPKYASFEHSSFYSGYEFVDQHDYRYSGLVTSVSNTNGYKLKDVTLYSCMPLQLGDAAWPGAAATVKHGQSIRVGAYIYTAWIFGVDYFVSGTTGATEPTWPTTPGDYVMDNEVEWLCAGLSLEWTMPNFARFVPIAAGAIARFCTPGGSATYPQITAGINGDLDKWMAATTLSKLTGNYSQHFADVTNTEGAKQFGIDLTTAGTDLDCTAVLAIRGYVVESDES
jgi:autotransporter adhesin